MITITNPVIWADVPDNDLIRVDDSFYMVSTSMHSMPGCPIMKSKDLKNWKIVSYLFDVLDDNPAYRLETEKGVYGRGSWAASLRKVGEWYYCLFNSNDMGHAYIFRTQDIEKSGWEKYELPLSLHDPALLIDGDRRYVLYGGGDIHIIELNEDMLSIKDNGRSGLFLETEKENIGLRCEGGHAYVIDGTYYFLYIEWPKDGNMRRREVCYRSKSLDGPFERKIILDDDMGYHNAGVAQGAIFDMPDGTYASILFQDHGAVGRIPYILPVTFEDGWPIPGVLSRVPQSFELNLNEDNEIDEYVRNRALLKQGERILVPEGEVYSLSASDSFYHCENVLSKHWQWNHNPDNSLWSFTDRPGYLRLKNGCPVKDMLHARNTLTQRTYGPKCRVTVQLDLMGMKNGDCAGITALQGTFGMLGIQKTDTEVFKLVMCRKGEYYTEEVCEEALYKYNTVFLRIEFDFVDNKDIAVFSFSTDNKVWSVFGSALDMKYTLDHFMGYRAGLYSYSTVESGGYADFKDFCFEITQ